MWFYLKLFFISIVMLFASFDLHAKNFSKPIPIFANKKTCVLDLSKNEINIGYDFLGEDFLIFGACSAQDVDIILEVRGPVKSASIKKRKKFFHMWLGVEQLDLTTVYSFYYISSNKPLNLITDTKTIDEIDANLENLYTKEESEIKTNDRVDFIKAFKKFSKENKLYVDNVSSLDSKENILFKANVFLPSKISLGKYDIYLFVFRNKKLIETHSLGFNVLNYGINKQINHFIQNYSYLYSIFIICLSTVFGLMYYIFFVRV